MSDKDKARMSAKVARCQQTLREQQEYEESQKRCRAFVVTFKMDGGYREKNVGDVLREIQSECTPDPNAKLSCAGHNGRYTDQAPRCVYIHQSDTRKHSHSLDRLVRCRNLVASASTEAGSAYYGNVQFPSVARSDRW